MKKVLHILFACSLLLVVSLLFIACEDSDYSLDIKEKDQIIAVGDTLDLDIDFQGELVFSSSDESIAKVMQSKITGVANGKCEIHFSIKENPKLEQTVTVTVYTKTTKLSIKNSDNTSYTGIINDEITLDVEISENSSVKLEWKVNNDNISYENNENSIKVKLLKIGTSIVAVKDILSGLESTFQITITDNYSLVINTLEITLDVETSLDIIIDSYSGTLKYVSTDESVAIVKDGKVTAVSAGECEINVYIEENKSLSSTIKVVVKDSLDVNKEFEEFLATIPEGTFDNLPTGNEYYDVEYVMTEGLVDSKGVIKRGEYDEKATGKVKFSYKDTTIVLEKDIEVLIYGTFTDEIYERYIAQIGERVDKEIVLKYTYEEYGGTRVIMKSSNEEVFTNVGKYTRPLHDVDITLTIRVVTESPRASRIYTHNVIIAGETIETKATLVKEWIISNYPANTVFYYDSVPLPDYCEEIDAYITWFDSDGNAVDFSKLADDPITGDNKTFNAKIIVRGKEASREIDYLVWNKKYVGEEGMREKIDDFVLALNPQYVRSFIYQSGGNHETNRGYLPFYTPSDTIRNQDYMLEITYKRVRTGIIKSSTEYIVVHDTAGSAPTHTAKSFAQDLVNQNSKENNQYISWHFTVGNDGIYQSLPLDEVAYHAGDGSYVYGDTYFNNTYQAWSHGGGNRNGIGIESCINGGSDYNVTMRSLAKLVAELMIEYNLSISRVQQHNFFSGKDCPGVIRHTNRWDEFLNLVKYEYFAKRELNGVSFTWKSLSPEILDDTGKVIDESKAEKTVKYSVTTKYGNETTEYSLSSIIKKTVDLTKGEKE